MKNRKREMTQNQHIACGVVGTILAVILWGLVWLVFAA
jgi:hypothetical protein